MSIENRAIFNMSDDIDDMRSLSATPKCTFRDISKKVNNKTSYCKMFSYMSRNIVPFKIKQHRRRGAGSLNWIFVPPGFSYLFSYYDNTCKLDEDLERLEFKYSYTKYETKQRYKMDRDEEEINYGYLLNKRG